MKNIYCLSNKIFIWHLLENHLNSPQSHRTRTFSEPLPSVPAHFPKNALSLSLSSSALFPHARARGVRSEKIETRSRLRNARTSILLRIKSVTLPAPARFFFCFLLFSGEREEVVGGKNTGSVSYRPRLPRRGRDAARLNVWMMAEECRGNVRSAKLERCIYVRDTSVE